VASTSVPVAARPAIGRTHDVDVLSRLVLEQRARLITLVGPGGVGKTRLAIALADSLRGAFGDQAAFVDLTAIHEPGLLMASLAEAFDVRETPARPIEVALIAALRATAAFVVLDNFEHVLSAAADVGRLLAACPRLTVVATSREPLGLSWEQLYPVAPLGVPDAHARSPEAVGLSAAVVLFCQQARLVRPDFELTSANAAAVAEVCRRLDGLPLAIELAAARVRVLAPDALLAQLRQRSLGLLASGPADAPTRHRTMRLAIAWSYDLLSPSQQLLLCRLSVFVGGWSLEAIDDLTSDTPVAALTALEALVDKHLVLLETSPDGEVRCRMLETIRGFGIEQLQASGEWEARRQAHARAVVSLVERTSPLLLGGAQQVGLSVLAREHDNIRAALEWAASSPGDEPAQIGLRLGGALWLFWRVRGFVSEGRARLERLLERSTAPTAARARALYADGYLAFAEGNADHAETLLTQSLEVSRQVGDWWSESYALQGLGHAALIRGQADAAAALYTTRQLIARERGDMYGLAQAQNALGEVARMRGQLERAASLYSDSLAIRRGLGDTRGVGMGLSNLGHVFLAQGDVAAARAAFEECLRLAAELGSQYSSAVGLAGLAGVALAEGRPAQAARLLGSTAAALDEVGSQLEPADRAAYDRTLAATRARLGAAAFERELLAGRGLPYAELVAMGGPEPQPPAATGAGGPGPATAGLSPREREIAVLIGQGRTSKEIGEILGITERTADTHAAHIRDKLGLRSRAEIAAWVARQSPG
jgi:predicted ATPase/DNA-binding CsgD family transcriptional regulator